MCFGTWFYGCGFNPGRWEPKTTGPNYDFGIELEPLTPFKRKINVFSRMTAWLDGLPPTAHAIAPAVIVQGAAPPIAGQILGTGPTLDSMIADAIGTRTRFRSLEASCTGSAKSSHSQREGSAANPSEVSPLALYMRIYGPGFKDPNATSFTPDRAVMVRRSVLSAVSEETKALRGSSVPPTARISMSISPRCVGSSSSSICSCRNPHRSPPARCRRSRRIRQSAVR